ncbi:MAG: hypothetical protein IKG55_04740, partial [Solobacterium sp.]|nr:hypothetical protein [Solobacterium sp.]
MTWISILGDSISTYEGCNPSGYAVYYDRHMQKINGLESMRDTWWAITAESLNASILINNSYSGSLVTGDEFPAASSYERTQSLGTAQQDPEYILVYIGFNDFGNGIEITNEQNDFQEADRCFFFEDAYELMLSRMKQRYPKAVIVCGTLMRTVIEYNDPWIFPENFNGAVFEDYNNAIRMAAKKQNVLLADLSAHNIR